LPTLTKIKEKAIVLNFKVYAYQRHKPYTYSIAAVKSLMDQELNRLIQNAHDEIVHYSI
jgi:hypothetical protein